MSTELENVQSSAPEEDLFGPAPVKSDSFAQRATAALSFVGRLAHKPVVVVKPVDEGHFMPALELHLEDVGAGHHSLVAHVLFRPDARAAAEATARRLQRGQRVTVTTQLGDIRLLLPAASLSTDDNP